MRSSLMISLSRDDGSKVLEVCMTARALAIFSEGHVADQDEVVCIFEDVGWLTSILLSTL
jgi:hypothetical protein